MPLDSPLAAPAGDLLRAVAKLRNESFHPLAPAGELLGFPLRLRGEDGHGESLSGPSA
jgi:hypothetical protein